MQNQRGFVIAPVLYLLGLIGVIGGVLFSNNLQILKSTQSVQNGIVIKADLQAAANTLSAEGVFSADGLTLCPPRSIHQSTGTPCAAAPVALTQLADFTGTQLPANASLASSTGSPTEVGVFTAGAGIKVLDAFGHTYIYCRWENPRSNPAAAAFVLLSAGADGTLQTKCGDSAAKGDDSYLMMTVGAAINRAALWQAVGTSNVSYGSTGSQVTIDNGGDLTTAGNLTVTGNATLGTSTLNNLTVSNAATFNGGLRVIGSNVGIGTTTPLNKLDVGGGVVIGSGYAGTTTAPTNGLLVQGNLGINITTTGSHALAVAGAAWAWSYSTNQGAGAYWANTASTAANPAYYITGGGGMFSPTTNVLGLAAGTTEVMRLTSSGTIGIGTPNPQATLDVNGTLKLLAQTSAPASCASPTKGAVAMTTNNGLCFCNGAAWNKMENPVAACAW